MYFKMEPSSAKPVQQAPVALEYVMSVLEKTDTAALIAKLQEDVARQEQTIAALKSNGHPCPDAERELQRLKEELALLM